MKISLKQIILITAFTVGMTQLSSTHAALWKPVCPEHVACSRPSPYSSPNIPLSPFVDQSGKFWLSYGSHFAYEIPEDQREKYLQRDYFRLSSDGMEFSPLNLNALLGPSHLGRRNTTQLTDILMVFSDTHVHYFTLQGQSLGSAGFVGRNFDLNSISGALSASQYRRIGPPAVLNGVVYVSVAHSAANPFISHRLESGQWQIVPYQSERVLYLAANPSGTGLWAVNEIWNTTTNTGSSILQESLDQGATWHQVGESIASRQDEFHAPHPGSLVIDSERPETVYVLFPDTEGIDLKGLYVSHDSGGTWQSTALQAGANSLVIIPGFDGKRLLVGTKQGVQISEDGGVHWHVMSAGLLAIPHTVEYSNGILLVTSAAGYYTCSSLDCSGESLPKGTGYDSNHGETQSTTIPAVEFYNAILDHYFLTTSTEEATGIDDGKAGPGWERTEHSFKVWPKLGAPTGAHVYRFYGSVNPGPNSHFFSISPVECGQLLELQSSTPEGEPRWHLEDYPFMAVPKQVDGTCPNPYQPVYRAYNNGFSQGKDSNHRFVTDRALLEPLFTKGWIDEGIGFCVPE